MTQDKTLRFIVYAGLIVQSAFLWNVWWGDATIYLCGSWLQFNRGEISGIYTSPLWAMLCSLANDPNVLKFYGIIITLLAAKYVMESVGKNVLTQLISVLILWQWLMYGSMGFETSLAILLIVISVRGKVWAWYLVGLVRPEAAIVPLIYGKGKHRFLALIPLAIWTLIVYESAHGSSILSRYGLGHFEWRYLAVFVTIALLEMSKRYGWEGLLVSCLIFSFSAEGVYNWTVDQYRRMYSFDIITMKEQAEFVNKVANASDVVLAKEVQVKHWLRPDLKVVSPEGLVTTGGRIGWRIISERDLPIDTAGWIPVYGWNVGRPGFVNQFELDKRR